MACAALYLFRGTTMSGAKPFDPCILFYFLFEKQITQMNFKTNYRKFDHSIRQES